jgi:hypothetical protein
MILVVLAFIPLFVRLGDELLVSHDLSGVRTLQCRLHAHQHVLHNMHYKALATIIQNM